MSEEKSQALVKYEPKHLTLRESLELYSELKRQEVEEALEKGYIRDPITTTIFGITAWHFLAGVAVSAALSIGAGLISSALRPKPARQRQGELTGEVQGLMRSEQGILINEVYGADPGDGKGGVKFPATIIWAIKPRKNVSVTRQSTGGGKSFGGGQTQEIENVTYDIDFAAMGGVGPLVLKREWANADKIIDLDKRGYYEGEDSSNTFTAPYAITDDKTASDGREATLIGSGGASSAVQFNAVVSHGATTRDLTIYYVNTGIISGSLIINGGTPVSISFPNSSNSRSSIVVSVSLNDGNNTIKIRNLSTTLNLRIDKIFCFPGFAEDDRTTGIIDPTISPDSTYDHTLPPDPIPSYTIPFERTGDVPPFDSYGVTTGQTTVGGNADYAIYQGTDTQLQDPVIEAAVDAQFGTGSTPAYRNRAYVRHSTFALTRWGGGMPNISQLWEHATLKNLAQIYGHWCDRVGMLSTDYDFSALTAVKVRGLLLSGRRYAPKEIMSHTEEIYDTFFTEVEGQLISLLQANAPQITIAESEIGWLEDEGDSIPSIDSDHLNEIELPKRIDVKFIDPDREFEVNTQGEARQITEGETQELLEVSITLTASEAKAVAARKLYREYVRGTARKFTLSWKYLYLYPGYIVNTTKNGISISTQITAKKGGIGILEIEAEDVEVAVYTQSPASDGGAFERLNAPIPQMSIAALMDTPLLRDKDETENNGVGFYACATPRTGDGVWNGASLYVEKVGWERIADFSLPATMGRQVLANGSASALPDGQTFVFDTNPGQTPNTITVDLYGTDLTLVSATETDVLNGQNACLLGDEVIQFTTATRVGGQPNRWTLSGLLRGRRGTEYATSTHVLNERFIFLNEAVKFVPMNLSDMNRALSFRMVSSGQSLDDAADLTFTWTNQSKQPLSVVNPRGTRDVDNNLLIQFEGRTRVGGGLRSNQAGAVNEEEEIYKVQILNSGVPVNREPLIVIPGTPLAMLLEADHPDSANVNTTNNSIEILTNTYVLNARSYQRIDLTGNYMEAVLSNSEAAGGSTTLGLIAPGTAWQGEGNVIPLCPLAVNVYGGSGIPRAISIYENNVEVLYVDTINVDGTGTPFKGQVKVKITFSGTEIRVLLQIPKADSDILYRATFPPTFPYHALLQVAEKNGTKITQARMTTYPFPATIYAPDQAIADGLTPGNPVQMDIWQYSKLVGNGQKVRVTL